GRRRRRGRRVADERVRVCRAVVQEDVRLAVVAGVGADQVPGVADVGDVLAVPADARQGQAAPRRAVSERVDERGRAARWGGDGGVRGAGRLRGDAARGDAGRRVADERDAGGGNVVEVQGGAAGEGERLPGDQVGRETVEHDSRAVAADDRVHRRAV